MDRVLFSLGVVDRIFSKFKVYAYYIVLLYFHFEWEAMHYAINGDFSKGGSIVYLKVSKPLDLLLLDVNWGLNLRLTLTKTEPV